jgi:hypothetical protein
LNAALSLGRKPEWLDNSRRVWFLGNLSLELQSRPVYFSLQIASDLITEALHVAAAHARSTFLLLDLNSKRRDQKFDASAKIVDCKPVEIEQLISVTADGRLMARSKSRELIASILAVTLESRLSGYVFQRKGKHRMVAFNSEIEITAGQMSKRIRLVLPKLFLMRWFSRCKAKESYSLRTSKAQTFKTTKAFVSKRWQERRSIGTVNTSVM